jgi:hypothetical protein
MSKPRHTTSIEEQERLSRYPAIPVALGTLGGGALGAAYGAMLAENTPHMRPLLMASRGTMGALLGAGVGFTKARDINRDKIIAARRRENLAARRAGNPKEASLPKYILGGAALGGAYGGLQASLSGASDWMHASAQGVRNPQDTKNRLRHIGLGVGLGALGGGLTGAFAHRAIHGRAGGSGFRARPTGSYKTYAQTLEFDPAHIKTQKQARDAYRKAAMRYHPDRNPTGADKMKDVNNAWEDMQQTDWFKGLKVAYAPLYSFLRARFA